MTIWFKDVHHHHQNNLFHRRHCSSPTQRLITSLPVGHPLTHPAMQWLKHQPSYECTCMAKSQTTTHAHNIRIYTHTHTHTHTYTRVAGSFILEIRLNERHVILGTLQGCNVTPCRTLQRVLHMYQSVLHSVKLQISVNVIKRALCGCIRCTCQGK